MGQLLLIVVLLAVQQAQGNFLDNSCVDRCFCGGRELYTAAAGSRKGCPWGRMRRCSFWGLYDL